MFKVLRQQKGFTLVELMTVAIIVAILAIVLVPLLTGNKRQAYATEAEASLGTVRTCLRQYFAANDAYPTIAAGTAVEGNVSGITTGDLTGTYFSGENFTISSTSTGYTVTCDWDADDSDATNDAPQQSTVRAIDAITTLDQDGAWGRTGY
ncbi:MAG: prepilin-type N-terminal cleavage/methylation domain-containing protein [Candidatus Omnitrophica bacterium]|nr:prepilin-type N-terminal cleavage/methylation domain-containing protein [Candidatus Omnitrophota bacterium]